jgi:O-antigen ligase
MAQTPVEPALTDQLNQKLIEFLNELRVALPGVQVLFAFLLAVPFANGWERVTRFQRDVFFVAFSALPVRPWGCGAVPEPRAAPSRERRPPQ